MPPFSLMFKVRNSHLLISLCFRITGALKTTYAHAAGSGSRRHIS